MEEKGSGLDSWWNVLPMSRRAGHTAIPTSAASQAAILSYCRTRPFLPMDPGFGRLAPVIGLRSAPRVTRESLMA